MVNHRSYDVKYLAMGQLNPVDHCKFVMLRILLRQSEKEMAGSSKGKAINESVESRNGDGLD